MAGNKASRDDKLGTGKSQIHDEELESRSENSQGLSKSLHSSQKEKTNSKIFPEDIEGEDIDEGKRSLP